MKDTKGLSDALIYDWQMLMSGIKQAAEKQPKIFKVEVEPDMTIIINGAKVICHFINFKYIEAIVSINKDDDVLKVRHFSKYSDTINIVLNFINTNLKK